MYQIYWAYIQLSLLNNGYDAILVAVGAHQSIRLLIEEGDFYGVLINMDFLRSVSLYENVEVGNKVVVLGGGNLAFDCACKEYD